MQLSEKEFSVQFFKTDLLIKIHFKLLWQSDCTYYFKQYHHLEEYEAGDRLMWNRHVYFSNRVICSTLAVTKREFMSNKLQ